MRQVSYKVCSAFLEGRKRKVGNTRTDGRALYLFDKMIAQHQGNGYIALYDAGYRTVTTKERLNALLSLMNTGYRIYQRNYDWYFWEPSEQREKPWCGGMLCKGQKDVFRKNAKHSHS